MKPARINAPWKTSEVPDHLWASVADYGPLGLFTGDLCLTEERKWVHDDCVRNYRNNTT